MPKNKTKHLSVKRKKRIITMSLAAVLLFLVALVLGANYYRHSQAQRTLINELDAAGRDLDMLIQSMQNAGITDTFTRSRDCYRASRKSGPEPIYCRQNLSLKERGFSDEESMAKIKKIQEVLEHNDSALSFSQSPEVTNFREDGTYALSYEETNKKYSFGCRGHAYARSEQWEDPQTRGSLELNIECIALNLDKPIYPEMVD